MVNWEIKGMAEVWLARYEFEILNDELNYLEREVPSMTNRKRHIGYKGIDKIGMVHVIRIT
jgi:hypothetical protein